MIPRTTVSLTLLALMADPAQASNNPSVGVYGDLAGESQQVTVAPSTPHQVYVLARDYPPFRGYGLGIFADPGIVVTGVSPFWSGTDGCGFVVEPENLHCAASTCVDEPSPLRLFLVSFFLPSAATDLTLCVGAPTSSPVEPPAPYYTPCTPVNTFPAELAPSPYGDGCVGITAGAVATETAHWGALKGRFE